MLILFLRNMLYCVANDEVPSTSSQIVEQIDVIQEVVLKFL